MNETHRPRRIGRSIGAVLAGLVATVILSMATDAALQAFGIFPPVGQRVRNSLLLLATAYRAIYSVASSLLTARLAPYRPMRHALAGGSVGVVISTVGTVVTWNGGRAFDPKWYPIAPIGLAMPCAWAGGKLHPMWFPERAEN